MVADQCPVVLDQFVHRGIVGLGRDRRQLDVAFQDDVREEVVPGDMERRPGLPGQVLVLALSAVTDAGSAPPRRPGGRHWTAA